MPQASPTAALFHRATAKVIDTYGERDENGELKTAALVLSLPGESEPLSGPCVRGMAEVVETFDGQNMVKETRETVYAQRSVFNIDAIPMKAVAYLDGVKYAIANAGSKMDESQLTLALVRAQMTQNNPLKKQ